MKTLPILLLLSAIISSCSKIPSDTFSEKDKTEIKQIMKDYRQAWMDADSTRVLNKLSNDVRMIRPGNMSAPIIGKKALAEFWFPPTDLSYPIFNYDISNEEINGSGELAFLQGTSRLSWCTLENGIGRDTTTNVSEYMTVLKKENGNWKIFRQIYNMKDETYSR